MLGATAMKRRHLQHLGWQVINVPYKVRQLSWTGWRTTGPRDLLCASCRLGLADVAGRRKQNGSEERMARWSLSPDLSMPWPWFGAGVGQVGVRSVKEGLPAGGRALKQQLTV